MLSLTAGYNYAASRNVDGLDINPGNNYKNNAPTIDRIIQNLSTLPPLLIKKVLYESDIFVLAGADWAFSNMSAWRIIQ